MNFGLDSCDLRSASSTRKFLHSSKRARMLRDLAEFPVLQLIHLALLLERSPWHQTCNQ